VTIPDVSGLPTDIDATFDDIGSPGRKAHQQHHDLAHAAIKALAAPATTAQAVATAVGSPGVAQDAVDARVDARVQSPTALLWVSPTGNDSASGRSMTAAKATIQAAVDALPITGGRVNILPGSYTQTVTSTKMNVHLAGYGGASGFGASGSVGAQSFAPVEIGTATPGAFVLTIGSSSSTDWRGWTIENIALTDRSATQDQAGGGIRLQRMNGTVLDNVAIHNFRAGTAVEMTGDVTGNPQYSVIRNPNWFNNLRGLHQVTRSSDTMIYGGKVWGTTTTAVPRVGSVGLDLQHSCKVYGTSVQYHETDIRITGQANRIMAAVETSTTGGAGGAVGVDVLSGAADNLIMVDAANAYTTTQVYVRSGALRTMVLGYANTSGSVGAAAIIDEGTDTLILDATHGLRLGRAMHLPIRTVTATATLGDSDHTVLVDATAGAVTINLPNPTTSSGVHRKRRVYVIKKIDASANAVTVDPAGTQQIDGVTTRQLTAQWAAMRVQEHDAAWYLI
jgi:hypothetical protein